PEVQPYIGIMQQAAVAAGVMLVDEHIHLEEEGPILTVHYRGAPDEEEARSRVIAVLGQLAEERNLTVFEGRKVVELRPPLPFGKGWSLRDVATARGLASVVYLGDDRTDVEAFDALLEWREEAPGRAGVALGVASAEMPPALAKVADYLLAGVIEVQQLLLELAGSLVG
ncbi:MAG: trehalose 6-phosphate phosphatase, partial [Chloroflexota bacterium]|nr:trehalose 6-phosphate phosphatase [Chloroflexota bacterium]